MPRVPLTEKNLLRIIHNLSSDDKIYVLYPITLSVGLAGSSSEIRKHLEKLADKEILTRYKSKIPFMHKIIGYGYYLPIKNNE